MDEGELCVSLYGTFLSVHENVSKVVCWFDSVLVPARKSDETSEGTSEVSWVVAWGWVSEWTSEVDLTLASVVALDKTVAVRLEVTTEGTRDGIPTVKLLSVTEVTSEKTCLWTSELEDTSEETLDGTSEVSLSLTSKTWVWTSELDETPDVKFTGLLELTFAGYWVVDSEGIVEGALELRDKVFTSEGTGVLTWEVKSKDSCEGTLPGASEVKFELTSVMFGMACVVSTEGTVAVKLAAT